MSFSFSVPAGPSADFEENAVKAKDAYIASLAGNDYMLSQLASGLVDEAIEVAVDIVKHGNLGDGSVSASLSGHAVPEGQSGSNSLNIGLSCAVTAPAAAPEPPAA